MTAPEFLRESAVTVKLSAEDWCAIAGRMGPCQIVDRIKAQFNSQMGEGARFFPEFQEDPARRIIDAKRAKSSHKRGRI